MGFVQAKKAYNFTGSNVTSLAVTLTSPVASGNCLVVAVTVYPDTNTITLTDDKSNAYTSLGTVDDTSDQEMTELFVLGNINNAPQTITANYSGNGSYTQIVAAEYTAIAQSNPSDGHAAQFVGAAAAGTDAIGSGTLTTTVGNDEIVAIAFQENANVLTISAGTGETIELNDTGGGNTAAIADKLQTSPGSVQGTFTLAGTGNTNYVVFAVALKASGATSWSDNAGLSPGAVAAPSEKQLMVIKVQM